jgi:hypothetical protein
MFKKFKYMRMKKCFKCGTKKELDDFYKHPQMPDGHVNKCKECNKEDVRKNYKNKREFYTAYDKDRIRNNFDYIFLHRYSCMRSRVEGRTSRHYNVRGREICSKEDFVEWCWSSDVIKEFVALHKKWKDSGYQRKLSPSIDRIDNNLGYTVDNIQWLTQQQNTIKFKKQKYE